MSVASVHISFALALDPVVERTHYPGAQGQYDIWVTF